MGGGVLIFVCLLVEYVALILGSSIRVGRGHRICN